MRIFPSLSVIKSGCELDLDFAELHGRTVPTTRILNLWRHQTDVASIPESSNVLITFREHPMYGRMKCPSHRSWKRLLDGHQVSIQLGITLTWGRNSESGTVIFTTTGLLRLDIIHRSREKRLHGRPRRGRRPRPTAGGWMLTLY